MTDRVQTSARARKRIVAESRKLAEQLAPQMSPRARKRFEASTDKLVEALESAAAPQGVFGRAAPPNDADQVDPVTLGQAAWQRLKAASSKSWDDWKLIGAALLAGRHHAMEIAKTNKPAGKRYNEAFHFWLQ